MGFTMFGWAIFTEVLELVNGFVILFWGNLLAIILGFFVFAVNLSSLENKEQKDINIADR